MDAQQGDSYGEAPTLRVRYVCPSPGRRTARPMKGRDMWAQLITVQVRPGNDIGAVIDAIKAAELPDSGLIHETFTRDQHDPTRFHMFAVFQSQEMARAREGDPRRTEAVATIQSMMRELLAAPPEFTDLDVIEDWTP